MRDYPSSTYNSSSLSILGWRLVVEYESSTRKKKNFSGHRIILFLGKRFQMQPPTFNRQLLAGLNIPAYTRIDEKPNR